MKKIKWTIHGYCSVEKTGKIKKIFFFQTMYMVQILYFPLIKCSEKIMDNSQNAYSSVEKTGKIKKNYYFLLICLLKKRITQDFWIP